MVRTPVRVHLHFCASSSPSHVSEIEVRARPRQTRAPNLSPVARNCPNPRRLSMAMCEAVCLPHLTLYHHIEQSSCHCLIADQLVSSNHDMSRPSPSSTFRSLFDVALQDYEKQTGTKLAHHALARQLEACDSVDSVTSFLQERAHAFHEFRGEDSKFMRSLKRVVHVLYTLSTNAALAESIGLVVRPKIPQQSHIPYEAQQPFPPTKAIFAGFAVLLAVHTFSRPYAYIFVSYKYLSGRPSKTPQRVMMHSWIYSSLWKASLTDLTFMQNFLLHQSWRRSL